MPSPFNSPSAAGPRIVVGVSDMAVSNNARVTLSTYALGSCVGVVGYDATARAGGILHFMLPDSALVPGKAAAQPAMFADTGLDLLLRALLDARAAPNRLKFLMAGGASMLGGYDSFKIGTRNVHAAQAFFATHGFAPPQSFVGGQLNRTLHLDIGTGALVLKSPNVNETHSLV
jgi:chemotaxis protein CheD